MWKKDIVLQQLRFDENKALMLHAVVLRNIKFSLSFLQ